MGLNKLIYHILTWSSTYYSYSLIFIEFVDSLLKGIQFFEASDFMFTFIKVRLIVFVLVGVDFRIDP